MANNDAVCDLMAENGNMKRLLAEMLPDMEARVAGMREAWPGREVLTALHRNERFVDEMKKFTDGFELPNAQLEPRAEAGEARCSESARSDS